ncbi:MAG TPA: hypothetical protein VIG42_01435 [Solirubrobacteraceae bacterium]
MVERSAAPGNTTAACSAESETEGQHYSHAGGYRRPRISASASPPRRSGARRAWLSARGWRVFALGCITASVLLAGSLPATASATTYDMRGEWALVLTATSEPDTPCNGVINLMNLATGEFSGNFEVAGLFPASLTGTITGTEALVTINTVSPSGPLTFIATKAAVNTSNNTFAGTGTYYNGKGEPVNVGEVSGERTKDYTEVLEREARELKEREEREARELKEREEREARELVEREERELKERTEHELKEQQEKAARETREKEAQELKARQEREAREASEKIKTEQIGGTSGNKDVLMPTELATRKVTVGHSRSISLKLTNPNLLAVTGHLELSATKKPGKSAGKKQAASLGGASFAISTNGSEVVKFKLSQGGETELSHRKKLSVVLTIVTEAPSDTAVTKTYNLVLRLTPPKKH